MRTEGQTRRLATIRALARQADREAVDRLIAFLADSDDVVRWAAAEALAGRGWEPADAREEAWYAYARRDVDRCARLGAAAIEPLIRWLGDDELFVGAARALLQVGEPAIAPLIQTLQDSRADVRARAAEILAYSGDPRAVEPLIRLLGDRNQHVRLTAQEGLTQLGDCVIEPLTKAIQGDDEAVDRRAVEVLARLDTPAAMEALLRLAGEGREAVRHVATAALAQKGRSAARQLVQVLADANPCLRSAAADALEQIHWEPDTPEEEAWFWFARREVQKCAKLGPAALKPLIRFLEDGRQEIRQAAAQALGNLRDRRAVRPLLAALQDRSRLVRAAAAEALDCADWQPGTAEERAWYWFSRDDIDQCAQVGAAAMPALVRFLQDRRCEMRLKAVAALGRLQDPRATGPLLAALDDEDPQVQMAAVRVLGRVGDPEVVRKVSEILKQPSAALQVRCAAAEALGDSRTATAIAPLIQALKNKEPSLREAAARGLLRLGDPIIEPLIKVIRGNNEALGCRAVEILGRLATPNATGQLVSLLGESRQTVRDAARSALVRMGRAAARWLVVALADANPQLRSAAADVLEQISWEPATPEEQAWFWFARDAIDRCAQVGMAAMPALARFLRDPRDEVRLKAVAALGRLQDPRATGLLLAALDDDTPEVQTAALSVLGRVSDSAVVHKIIETFEKPSVAVQVRCAAAGVLARFRDSGAIGSLIRALADMQPLVREAAARELVQLGDFVIEPLTRTIREGNPAVGCRAVEVLARLDSPAAMEALLRLAGENRETVRHVSAALAPKGRAAAKELVRALADANSCLRSAAADVLEQIRWEPDTPEEEAWFWFARRDVAKCADLGPAALEPLIRFLEDDREEVRQAAATALGNLRDRRAVRPLLAALQDRSVVVRVAAAEALGTCGDSAISESLVSLVSDPDERVRSAVALALGRLREPRAATPLAGLLADPSPKVRHNAAEALLSIGSPSLEPVIECLEHTNPEARCAAAELLGRLGDQRAIGALIACWHDEAEPVRHAAAGALVSIGPAAVEAVIRELQNDHPRVRSLAAATLGKLGDPRAIEPLMAALEDAAPEARDAAAGSLLALGIVRQLQAHDAVRRQRAVEALDRLGWRPATPEEAAWYWFARGDLRRCAQTGAAAVEPLLRALADPGSPDRLFAATWLGRLADPRAIQPMVTALADPDPEFRRGVMAALALLGEPAIEPLIHCLGHENPAVRAAAAEVLGRLGDPRSVEPLIRALADEAAPVRRAAAEALGWLEADQALEPLSRLITDGDEDVRLTAAWALTWLGWTPANMDEEAWHRLALKDPRGYIALGPAAVEPLIHALRSADEGLRRAAAEGLEQLGDDRAVEPLIRALTDPSAAVRRAAAHALGKLRDPRAWEPLKELWNNPAEDMEVWSAAGEALAVLEELQESELAAG